MGVFQIIYNFSWGVQKGAHFVLDFDEDSVALLNDPPDEIPDWVRLDYCQCPNCPFDPDDVDYCPTAVSLIPVVKRFKEVKPHDTMMVETFVSRRRIIMEASPRRAISSIVGLLFASSGCPHTIYFRPMVRFHVPVSSENETIMRAMSMYTLSQYFKHINGEAPDMNLDGLRAIYDELQTVNMTMAERLRSAEGAASSVNSVILLDMYTKMIPEEIDNSLKDLAYLFKSFLK